VAGAGSRRGHRGRSASSWGVWDPPAGRQWCWRVSRRRIEVASKPPTRASSGASDGRMRTGVTTAAMGRPLVTWHGRTTKERGSRQTRGQQYRSATVARVRVRSPRSSGGGHSIVHYWGRWINPSNPSRADSTTPPPPAYGAQPFRQQSANHLDLVSPPVGLREIAFWLPHGVSVPTRPETVSASSRKPRILSQAGTHPFHAFHPPPSTLPNLRRR
jgi:hypothetical protein